MKESIGAVGAQADAYWSNQLRRVRIVLTAAAIYAAAGAGLLWDLRATEAFVPWLWPLLWGIGGVAAGVCAARADRVSFTVSLVALSCGHAGRAVAVVLNTTHGTVKVGLERAALGTLLYGFLALGFSLVWLLLIQPVVWRAGRAPR